MREQRERIEKQVKMKQYARKVKEIYAPVPQSINEGFPAVRGQKMYSDYDHTPMETRPLKAAVNLAGMQQPERQRQPSPYSRRVDTGLSPQEISQVSHLRRSNNQSAHSNHHSAASYDQFQTPGGLGMGAPIYGAKNRLGAKL